MPARQQQLRVERIPISRQGYDSRGQYWGVGKPLYYIVDVDTQIDVFVRADSAKQAREIARPHFAAQRKKLEERHLYDSALRGTRRRRK